MKKPRNRQLQKIVRGPKLTDVQLDDVEETIAFFIASILRQDLNRRMLQKKARLREQEIVRKHLSQKDIAYISDIVIAYITDNDLTEIEFKDIEKMVADRYPHLSQDFIISLVKFAITGDGCDGYDEDLRKMLWSFEEIAGRNPNLPTAVPIKKCLEAAMKKDENEAKKWRKKKDDIDPALVQSYYEKISDGIRLFAKNFFDIEYIFIELQNHKEMKNK